MKSEDTEALKDTEAAPDELSSRSFWGVFPTSPIKSIINGELRIERMDLHTTLTAVMELVSCITAYPAFIQPLLHSA